MNPFYFGERSRRLFGVYHDGSATDGPPRALVLCNSWGPEYINSHRTVRQAAIQLAAAGFHVLRFDYFGTGDSAGDLTDANVAMWEDDIRTALHEVMAMSGAARVGLVGLRFGAVLANRVALTNPVQVDRLLLWDPVLNGSAYVDELFYNCDHDADAFRELRTRPRLSGGGHEVHGFPLTDGMAREIRSVSLDSVSQFLESRCDVLISGPERDELQVRQRLVPPLAPSSIERVAAPPCWMVQWPVQLVSLPAEFLRRLVERARGVG
jgi:pimeloyl-ACP methyl ester carboxylesterase